MNSLQGCLSGLLGLISTNKVVSIAGKSGTGKTTLTQMFVGNLLTYFGPEEYSCIWVQASELFSSKRAKSIFKDPEAIKYILDNIYPYPPKRACQNFEEQAYILNRIHKYPNNLPPDLKCVVIDNISHHLRYKISIHSNIGINSQIKDDFYSNQLFPLIMFCVRNDILLFLIHEASYDPNSNETKAFYHKLYDRIEQLHIFLELNRHNQIFEMRFKSKAVQGTSSYKIEDEGLVFKE